LSFARAGLPGVAAVLCCCFAAAAAPVPTGLQHITLIGDSVAEGIDGSNAAKAVLQQELEVDYETAPCRRVYGSSCAVQSGTPPPSVVDLTRSLGSKLGPNVVVSVGYNDFDTQYAQNIVRALAAFKAAGVTHVWWLTLRATHTWYLDMNQDILAAAQAHPELSVIDWNLYSRSHPEWFQADGVHLVEAGAVAMATLIHQSMLHAGVALPPVAIVTGSLPDAHRGKSYTARLRADEGVAPYRWSLTASPPKGIHVGSTGAVYGRPHARPGRYVLDVRVVDGSGLARTRHIMLRIRG
jgi:hypothetical protein